MAKLVSIVHARRELGRLAEEVRRSGESVVLTRRGRPVARITPDAGNTTAPKGQPLDLLASVKGTVRLKGGFADLVREVRRLRREFTPPG